MRDMAKFILVAALALLMVGGALAQGTKTPPKATPAVPSPRATVAHMKHHNKHLVRHHRKHHHKHHATMSSKHELKPSNGSTPEKPVKHKSHRGASHLRTSTGQRGGAVPSKTSTTTAKSMTKESTKARTVVSTKKATTKTSQKGTVQRK